jgi:hypothetical protein
MIGDGLQLVATGEVMLVPRTRCMGDAIQWARREGFSFCWKVMAGVHQGFFMAVYQAMLAIRRNKPRAVVQVDRLFLARTVLFVKYFLSQSSCEGASNMYYLLVTIAASYRQSRIFSLCVSCASLLTSLARSTKDHRRS